MDHEVDLVFTLIDVRAHRTRLAALQKLSCDLRALWQIQHRRIEKTLGRPDLSV